MNRNDEWFGNVPNHWKRERLKYLCDFIGGGTPDKSEPEYWSGDIPWVSPKDMRARIIEDTEDQITPAGLTDSAARLIDPGAVLIVMRSGILRHSIPVAINRVRTALNQDMRALIPSARLNHSYLAWLIEGQQKALLLAWSKEGTTVESLESELVASTLIPLPPLREQNAIVDYLDHEVAQLDALAAAKERLLGILAEKRRALVTCAVTRGLADGVLMRDTGVPWLGEIPAHWDVLPLKRQLHGISQGWSPQCDNVPASENEWGVLKVGCVNGERFNPDENKRLPAIERPITELEIKSGDVLVSRANTRELLGSAALVENVRPRLLLCDKLYRLDVNEAVVDRSYLVAVLRSDPSRFVFERDATGASASMQNITQESIASLPLPMPPIAEQCLIVEHIAQVTRMIDGLRATTERTLSLLRERRAALITSAVTGGNPIRTGP